MARHWVIEAREMPHLPARGREQDHGALSPTLLRLIRDAGLAGRDLLDVGCGKGRLTLALASEARAIMGIDIAEKAVAAARRAAEALGLTNVTFRVADAEQVDYRTLGRFDCIVANLCMSDAILRRSAGALPPGAPLAFAAFHTDQWIETGQPSRFAYSQVQMEESLRACGFAPVYLGLEKGTLIFTETAEALAYLEAVGLRHRWEGTARWARYQHYLEAGGRRLTVRSHLIVKALRQ